MATKIIQEDARQVSSNQAIAYDVRIIDAPVAVLSVSVWFHSYNLYFHAPLIPSSLRFFLSPRQGRQKTTCLLPAVCKISVNWHSQKLTAAKITSVSGLVAYS